MKKKKRKPSPTVVFYDVICALDFLITKKMEELKSLRERRRYFQQRMDSVKK